MGMTPVLRVEGATVIRGGATLLDDVSLAVAPGAVTVLVGPNGAGKTTLLGVMAGDIVPDRGRVTLRDRSLARIGAAELARLRAVLPQQTLLQFGFRSREVVAMGRAPLPASVRDRDEAVIDASLAATEGLHLTERQFPTLSGGEQTRVSLARVLAQETPLILLDEPTAALDIRHQQMVMSTAQRLAGEGGAVVAILHDLNLALAHAGRIVVLDRGRIVRTGTPWDVARSGVLGEVFRCPLAVIRHPQLACPLVLSGPFDSSNADREPADQENRDSLAVQVRAAEDERRQRAGQFAWRDGSSYG